MEASSSLQDSREPSDRSGSHLGFSSFCAVPFCFSALDLPATPSVNFQTSPLHLWKILLFFNPKISSLGHREAVYRPPSYPEVRIDYFIYLFLQSAGKVNCGDQSSNVKLIPKMLA